MNIRTKAMLVSLIAVLAPPLSRAQLVDGGFELPHVATGTSASYFAGDDMGGWTVLGSSGVSLINSEYSEPQNGITGFNAYEGTQALDITGINDDNHPTELSSGVTQTVSTVAGAAYTLQFYVGRASGSSSIYGTPAVVRLEINGGTPISFTNSNSVPGAVDWQQFVYNFTASGSSTSITFLNGTTSNNYDGVDDVTLVPEPSTWMLLGVSAGLLILTVHRRAACV